MIDLKTLKLCEKDVAHIKSAIRDPFWVEKYSYSTLISISVLIQDWGLVDLLSLQA